MADNDETTIRKLKEQYGANSPAVAEQLNSIGAELQSRGHNHTALKFHQEALTILEWNKCNAILYDFVEKSKHYAIEMARTLHKIGNLLREMNNFVGAAEVYKEALDTFLEALIEGGGGLKRKLLESEYKKDSSSQAVLARVDRKTIGRILSLNSHFRDLVRDISELVSEMQCVKFVGQSAASSRRRRRMVQHAAVEENLKQAVESLSMSTTNVPESSCNEKLGETKPRHRRGMSRSKSWTSATSDTEGWMKCFWEKEMGRFSRPRPLSRRAITTEEEYDYYKVLASMIIPAEESLVVALKRFPLPSSVLGDNKYLRQRTSSLNYQEAQGHSEMDSEERTGPSPHLSSENLSPRSVTRHVFQDDNFDLPKNW